MRYYSLSKTLREYKANVIPPHNFRGHRQLILDFNDIVPQDCRVILLPPENESLEMKQLKHDHECLEEKEQLLEQKELANVKEKQDGFGTVVDTPLGICP